ncbi:MAG: glycosyltransferase family 2 protein, partial [Candidatus Scalindua sp.]|nr:glycosyltransferase family 2 protein [Candidatus Scalindua sp.]
MILPLTAFIGSLFVLIYIYFLYPICIYLLCKLFPRLIQKGNRTPSVTILIAAFNEEKHIYETIRNKLELDYPSGLFDIIVISDSSTDRTDEIVLSFDNPRVKLLRQEPRGGKTSALNMAVLYAKGEIILFSDANSIYANDVINRIVKSFDDPDVGYITGKMVYSNPDGSIVGDGCSAYMKYENFLRKHETAVGSVVGVDGGIDAVRKNIYKPMRPDQLPDFILPLNVIKQGYRVIYEPDAILKEQTLQSFQDEYKMRVRVSLRSFWALKDMVHLFNPFKYGVFSWQIFSHKLLRYVAFIFMISLYISNIFLINYLSCFLFFFLGQNLFYMLSI